MKRYVLTAAGSDLEQLRWLTGRDELYVLDPEPITANTVLVDSGQFVDTTAYRLDWDAFNTAEQQVIAERLAERFHQSPEWVINTIVTIGLMFDARNATVREVEV